jgi:phosphoglycolate phosphatase-like HAD superfamily hydrolase
LPGVVRFEVHPAWRDVLANVLADAARLGPAAVLAFDLDSTLLDNRPRQAALVQRYVREHGGSKTLAEFDAAHLHTGFDMRDALVRHGLSSEEALAFLEDFRPYWRERFFKSDVCQWDVPVRGAPAYVQRASGAGAQVAYVTARPEEMRLGTLQTLKRYGFPVPGRRVELWMKADAEETDEEFKRDTHQHLKELGQVLAAFDNEPSHANDYRASFPDATVVLLATGHSGRVSTLAPGILAAPHFEVESPGAKPQGE